MTAPVEAGRIRLEGVSRRYKIVRDRNLTLKETLLRRRRTAAQEIEALIDVTAEIEPGDAVGIVGKNGSGKSTLLKLLAGIIPPHAGTVEAGGSVAALLELGAGFHPDFSGRENVYLNGSLHGFSRREISRRMEEIVAFAELEEFIDAPVRTYSSGMYMRLAFALSSHIDADVLLLDEVLAVGDEAFQKKCMARIFEYRRSGGTLVLVSHDPNAIERVCDRALLLEQGRLVSDGPSAEVLVDYHRALAAEAAAGGVDRPAAATEGHDRRIWGSGRVEIVASRLLGRDGPSDRFLSGEPFTIEMDVEPREPVRRPTYGIAIHTADGTLLFGTNTRLDTRETGILDEPTTVRFRIPALPLHEGAFVVQLAVQSFDEGETYRWLDRWLPFTVIQSVQGIGMVSMPGDWEVAPTRAAEGSGRDAAGITGAAG